MAVNGVTAADFISFRISWISGWPTPSGVVGGGGLMFNLGGCGRILLWFIGGRCLCDDDDDADDDDDEDDEPLLL